MIGKRKISDFQKWFHSVPPYDFITAISYDMLMGTSVLWSELCLAAAKVVISPNFSGRDLSLEAEKKKR